MVDRRHRLARAFPCSVEKRFEESPMELVLVEQKLWMPLNSEKKPLGRRFDGLDNAVRCHSAGH